MRKTRKLNKSELIITRKSKKYKINKRYIKIKHGGFNEKYNERRLRLSRKYKKINENTTPFQKNKHGGSARESAGEAKDSFINAKYTALINWMFVKYKLRLIKQDEYDSFRHMKRSVFYYDKLNRAVSSWLKYGVFKVLGDGHKKKGLIDSNREDIIKLFDLYRQNYKKTSDSRKKKIEKLKKKIIGNIFYDSGSVSLLEGHIRGYHEITSNNAIDAGALGKLKVKWDEIPNIDRMNLRQYRTLKNWGFDVDTLDTIKESEFKDIGIKMINAVLNNKLFTKLSTKYYQLKYNRNKRSTDILNQRNIGATKTGLKILSEIINVSTSKLSDLWRNMFNGGGMMTRMRDAGYDKLLGRDARGHSKIYYKKKIGKAMYKYRYYEAKINETFEKFKNHYSEFLIVNEVDTSFTDLLDLDITKDTVDMSSVEVEQQFKQAVHTVTNRISHTLKRLGSRYNKKKDEFDNDDVEKREISDKMQVYIDTVKHLMMESNKLVKDLKRLNVDANAVGININQYSTTQIDKELLKNKMSDRQEAELAIVSDRLMGALGQINNIKSLKLTMLIQNKPII